MKITQIRNATLVVEFGGIKFLIDPMLAKKDAYPGLEGTLNSHIRYPSVDLGTPLEEILAVDAVIITHTHPDHFDQAARELIPKHLPFFVQHEADLAIVKEAGFSDTRLLESAGSFNGVRLYKTPGRHGTDAAYAAIGPILGEVCGVVFKHPDEETLYIAGDTIWNEDVQSTLHTDQPQVIVLNCGDAQIPGIGSILMDQDSVLKVHQTVPQATLIASHLEAVNHCVLTREALAQFAQSNGMQHSLLIPEDGKRCEFATQKR